MRGKGVTMLFQDRSVVVVRRDVVGYGRPDSTASRFAHTYHARWPSVRLEAFGVAARQVRAKAAATVTPAPQTPPRAAEIHDMLLGAALAPDKAVVEVTPESMCDESVGDSVPAFTEPEQCSDGISVGPSAENTNADVEMDAPEQEDGANEGNMADLADVDPPEFTDEDVEVEEGDEFKPR